MQVSTSDLRALTEQLISHLEKKGYHSIEVSSDYYWNIAQESRYDPYQEPLELDLGQLTDDWAELQNTYSGGIYSNWRNERKENRAYIYKTWES